MYGLNGVPEPNYARLEYRERAEEAGAKLYEKYASLRIKDEDD